MPIFLIMLIVAHVDNVAHATDPTATCNSPPSSLTFAVIVSIITICACILLLFFAALLIRKFTRCLPLRDFLQVWLSDNNRNDPHRTSSMRKRNQYAPTDPTKPFAVVFTDIESSTALWAEAPLAMSAAVETHHRIIRSLLEMHHGFEVKTIGDSFMAAFCQIEDAVRFAMDLQLVFVGAKSVPSSSTVANSSTSSNHVYEVNKHLQQELGVITVNSNDATSSPVSDPPLWPAELNQVYERLTQSRRNLMAVDDPRNNSSNQRSNDGNDNTANSTSSWNGLRVRVGIHWGYGTIQLDPVTERYDYYGTVVNTAARVESVGHGGQILISSAALEGLEKNLPLKRKRNSFSSNSDNRDVHILDLLEMTSFGPQFLRGLPEPIILLQVLPKTLSHRTFPPLRLDITSSRLLEDEDEGNASSSSGEDDTETVASTHPSHNDGVYGLSLAMDEDNHAPSSNGTAPVTSFFSSQKQQQQQRRRRQSSVGFENGGTGISLAIPNQCDTAAPGEDAELQRLLMLSSRGEDPAAVYRQQQRQRHGTMFESYEAYAESLLSSQPGVPASFPGHVVRMAQLWHLTLSTSPVAYRKAVIEQLCQHWHVRPLKRNKISPKMFTMMNHSNNAAGGTTPRSVVSPVPPTQLLHCPGRATPSPTPSIPFSNHTTTAHRSEADVVETFALIALMARVAWSMECQMGHSTTNTPFTNSLHQYYPHNNNNHMGGDRSRFCSFFSSCSQSGNASAGTTPSAQGGAAAAGLFSSHHRWSGRLLSNVSDISAITTTTTVMDEDEAHPTTTHLPSTNIIGIDMRQHQQLVGVGRRRLSSLVLPPAALIGKGATSDARKVLEEGSLMHEG